jgi:hypothetical protein
MPKILNLKDQVFDRLTAKESTTHRIGGSIVWRCECQCGNKEVYVPANMLVSLNTGSCGCSRTKHGDTYTILYQKWRDIIQRCRNPRNKRYKDYGGRGITVCDQWLEYENFRNWALENGYDDKLTIDRVDNHQGYCPGNCRWATRKEQQRNMRSNHLLTACGQTKTLIEWSENTGLAYNTIRLRLKRGWSPDRALTEPVKEK